MSDWESVRQALLAPFGAGEVQFLRKAGGSFPYLPAEAIERRLDRINGLLWDFTLQPLPDGDFIGRLTLRFGAEIVTREDVGEWSRPGTNEAGKGMTDTVKAAATDAFKRTAYRAGIGRFLNYLPTSGHVTPEQIREACVRAGWKEPAHLGPSGEPPPGPPEAAPAAPGAPPAAPDAEGRPSAPPAPPEARRPSRYDDPRELEAPPADLVCRFDGCGAALTKGQRDVSVRTYGHAFCPMHQREMREQAAAAAGN
jgi:hypothetical protein